MMKEADARHGHGDIIFITGCDNMIITDRAARLRNIGHAAAMSSFDIVAEREKRIAAESHAAQLFKPRLFLVPRERFGTVRKYGLPHAVGKNVLIIIGNIYINRIVALRAADIVFG